MILPNIEPAWSLEFSQTSYRYAKQSNWALHQASFNLPAGAIVGLLGPNGAGKSTLMQLLCGLLKPTVGHVTWLQDRLITQPTERHLSAPRISLVPQEYAFYPTLTCQENLECFAGAIGLKGAEKAQRIAESAAFCELTAQHLTKRAEDCSGGIKRRLNMAIGLLNQPEWILFDEPTVGIDPRSRQAILQHMQTLAAQGATIIFASHHLEEVAQLCNHLVLLQSGQVLAAGPTQTLLNRPNSTLSLEQFYTQQTQAFLDRQTAHGGGEHA